MGLPNPFNTLSTLPGPGDDRRYYSFSALEKAGFGAVGNLPLSLRILLESTLRSCDNFAVTEEHIASLANWRPQAVNRTEIPFVPARILLQDFTGVPCLVDIAAMRSALARMGGDPQRIQPRLPVDLVIDHSVQVDFFGARDALARNAKIEFERNRERYEFLKWGQNSIANVRIAPPATGIVHQVNLEYLASVVFERKSPDGALVYPDSVVGTDSHTPMVNGLGVLGWGVGGIEAESAMLGYPMFMQMPDVIGFKLTGALPEGATATDLALTITETLRKKGVVEKFVEFYGSGLSSITLPDRATISNMSPEQGATVGYFPIDDETLRYLRLTGRSETLIDLVERYAKEQSLFRTDDSPDPIFSDTITLDLATVEPSLAGPKRPHDRVRLGDLKKSFRRALTAPIKAQGFNLEPVKAESRLATFRNGVNAGKRVTPEFHGDIVIAAITSCTNTSNPSVMLAAGLVAKKAIERGLATPAFVKTSLAPGSKVVTEYLIRAGVLPYLEQLGFYVVAYGCTTCIGNSGPLPEIVANAIIEKDLVAASVLSGNRNFEGRVHPQTRANYLCSPPLVVAYALAGTMDIDLASEPLGYDKSGAAVFLRDIWPSNAEIRAVVHASVNREMFTSRYAEVWSGNADWNAIPGAKSALYAWEKASTYIQEPSFFTNLAPEPAPIRGINGARTLALFGDSVTTDHISPAGSIAKSSPAGLYLQSLGVAPQDFNSYGSRRGNDRVMSRGTFANIRIRNLMLGDQEGGDTIHQPSGEGMSIFDAAMRYQSEGTPLMIFAGKEYGSGSSRDWAAKGPALLGVRAIVAESYERIHRNNLIGMGILPLQFATGESIQSHGLTGAETFDILDLSDSLAPRQTARLRVTGSDGRSRIISTVVRLDTPVEVSYYRHGGILHAALREMARA